MINLTSYVLPWSASDPATFPPSLFIQMKNISVEFCIISARGLGRKSSLLKPQWFSVGWVDPNSKYCTKIDASRNSDASWGTKFSVSVNEHDPAVQRMELTVEVYKREPIFLREHLQGATVVQMKEYLDKFAHGEEHSGVIEETGSFQLRRKKSEKAHGFVDISIRICKEEDHHGQFEGSPEGLKHPGQIGITLAIEDGPVYNYPPPPYNHHRGYSEDADHYSNPMPPIPETRPDPSPYSYQPQMVPSTLPPSALNPSFFPPQYPGRGQVPQNYINLPARKSAGQNSAPNFGMGLGAGALAAGTAIFGETLLPGPSFSVGLNGASLSVYSDAPF